MKLLGELANERESLAGIHRRRVPMLVKVAPDLGDEDLEAISRALRQSSFDGVVATNTTIARPSSLRSRHAGEAGGLSGAPLHEQSVRTIRGLRRHLGSSFPIVGVGGICDAGTA
ncbi:MAG TPA: quinone-dependent dihydroorotate dehydrogenase, partial [Gammaproteobacteria bacterium]